MLTTLTNVRADVALAWLEAPDVASLGLDENEEPTFAETMAAIAYGPISLDAPSRQPAHSTATAHPARRRSEEIADPN